MELFAMQFTSVSYWRGELLLGAQKLIFGSFDS